MMSCISRVALLLAVVCAVRVDEDHAANGVPKTKAKHVQEAKENREEQVVKQAADVATAFTTAHKVTEDKAKVAVAFDKQAKASMKEASTEAKKATKHMHDTTKVYENAKAIEEKAIADRHAKEEKYARAWGVADEAELVHKAAVEKAQATAAASAAAKQALEKARAEQAATNAKMEKTVAIAHEHSSEHAAVKAESKALQTKAIQLVKHKVVTEKIATEAAIKQGKAAKAKAAAEEKARAASQEHVDAEQSAEEAVVANSEARDVSNLKTGLAFRALQDKVKSDLEAEHHKHGDKVMRLSVAVVNNQIEKGEAEEDTNETESANATAAAPEEA